MLLWGLPAVGIPILIHLINMLRHRRVEWAAMEFLLVSQKKHRIWVLFKQLLLLLLRMAAIAAIVLMISRPHWNSDFGRLLGTTQTHHIILLDDSFSMSDRWEQKSAFREAIGAIKKIADEATHQQQPQRFTLLRYSRVAQGERGTQADMFEMPVNRTEFPRRLDRILTAMEVSETTAGPIRALKEISQLMDESDTERRIVYIISDFRAREWDDPTELKSHLQELNEAEAEIHLVNCVRRSRPNLAITSLKPGPGIRAAGVPLFMEVTVENFGTEVAKEVSVLLEEDDHARPAVTIAEVRPGEDVTERFQVRYATAGEHLATARLDEDAVVIDNYRYSTVKMAAGVPVLIVDGIQNSLGSRFLDIALVPGGAVRMGLNPQIETPQFLSREPLDRFGAINLLNIELLDPLAIRKLEEYVNEGGGVAFFLSENSSIRFINDSLYRDGKGLFPVPVLGKTELLIDRLTKAPDIEADKQHFIFGDDKDDRKEWLDIVIVEQYFSVPDSWLPESDPSVRVIARLRNGAPLVVERPFGDQGGKVLVFLTTAAPHWNNWARNPSFPPVMLDLQGYLSNRPADDVSQQVGSKLEVTFDGSRFLKQVRFGTPMNKLASSASTVPIEANPVQGDMLSVTLPTTDTKGIYQVLLTERDGGATEVRSFAVNVDAAEGNLKALSISQLTNRLDKGEYINYEQATDFSYNYTISDQAGRDITDALLYLLLLMLIGEQILAWSASYHPPAPSGMALAKGGVQ